MTKRYAVIGDPVSHSLSPLMHAAWIADHGLDATYEPLRLVNDDPVTAIRNLTGLAGANVTVPHKVAAAAAADRSERGVANVLRWEPDGSLSAFSTDGPGFLDSLGEAAPAWRSDTQQAAIVGAGGAARDIGWALAQAGVAVVFINRTLAHARTAAAEVSGARAAGWDELREDFAAADLIVNATTLGLAGAASPHWPLDVCRPTARVADIVYRPLQTPLLRAARARGLQTIDGLGMLVCQGARAFALWFGLQPDRASARARLLEALRQ